ncbi:MAG: hypothetical protein RL077_2268 [Verrucomicrobiota bacterium]
MGQIGDSSVERRSEENGIIGDDGRSASSAAVLDPIKTLPDRKNDFGFGAPPLAGGEDFGLLLDTGENFVADVGGKFFGQKIANGRNRGRYE